MQYNDDQVKEADSREIKSKFKTKTSYDRDGNCARYCSQERLHKSTENRLSRIVILGWMPHVHNCETALSISQKATTMYGASSRVLREFYDLFRIVL